MAGFVQLATKRKAADIEQAAVASRMAFGADVEQFGEYQKQLRGE